ncbi:MAG TPA: hypothetical protein DDZ99_06745, partial [Clostridiales bacterium]|nr:hypothetical protein [Clostridiales bacterium]
PNWGDLLTSYNGTSISYDAIGNPTNWRNISGLTWQGRELSNFYDTGYNTEHQYKYNENGIRTNKYIEYWVDGGYTNTSYVLDGSKILKETRTGNQNLTLYYYYDSFSSVAYFNYNGTNYYYGKNYQGDVKYIYDSSGQIVVEYSYDSWGNIISTTGSLASTIGIINPFRYSSYYFDTETGFYYLNSRYYDPNTGRFINSDGMIGANQDLLSYNLFAYCSNNPANYDDPSGYKKYTKGYGSFGYGSFCSVMDTDGDGEVDLTDPEPCDAKITSKNYKNVEVSDIKPKPICNTFNQCFVAGTLVSTENGNKPIEEIKAGDLVWSENPETGEKALKRVMQTFVNETDVLVHVFIGEQEIITTEEHPFWVEGKGWVDAAELQIGDIVRTNNDQTLFVCKIYVEKLSSPVKVYNFEVEDFHTYYVGDDSILVHNDCKDDSNFRILNVWANDYKRIRSISEGDTCSDLMPTEY